MIKPKELRKHINQLSQMADLVVQMERQVDFWRTNARNQMKKNTERTVIVSKSDLSFSDLLECWYYEDENEVRWYIFDDNMYFVNDEHTYTLLKIQGTGDNTLGVII